MIVELGHLALINALMIALLLGSLPLIGCFAPRFEVWQGLARAAAWALLLMVGLAYMALTWAFLQDDFSVAYVAGHSNSRLPLLFKFSAVWGGHEGSLLLWMLMLAGWTAAVAGFSRNLSKAMTAQGLAVLGLVSCGFLLFMLFTSNPFIRLWDAPAEGRDLNPLLQDFGLAVHPPMLYMGYVGFSVAFAFACAALISGKLDGDWARQVRPWTNAAWGFLTIGITLGSWWAYYELGWGGWWFWDPVENASFMPWLSGTALIHALAVTEKRQLFKAWSLLLALLTFSLSLLGTFLVRSGVLTSVHAFANDPERGLFILVFLCVATGGALALYAWRAPQLGRQATAAGGYAPISRETSLLVNNIFLCVLCFCVLLGTLYPLFYDALGLGKLSVGAPYFNLLFTLFGIPLALLVGIGALLRWKQEPAGRLNRRLGVMAGCSALAGLAAPLAMLHYSWGAALAAALGCWITLISLSALAPHVYQGGRWRRCSPSIGGMTLAHIGVGVFIIGVCFTSIYSVEQDVAARPGQRFAVAGYVFEFAGVHDATGANYQSKTGTLRVFRDARLLATLHPEKRVYLVDKNPMTEAAIDPGLRRDLYVALGEPLDAGGWSLRLHYKPAVRWIWLGSLLMAAGGLLAAADRRYRKPAAGV